MKSIIIVTFGLFISITCSAQNIFGKWKSISEEGEEKSIIEIYEDNGKVYGKITELLNPSVENPLCKKCEGDDYNKPIQGLVIIKDLTFDGNYYRNGTIFDPEKGKSYKCRLALDKENPEVLEVRGYIAFMYKTQYWKRAK